VDSSSPRNTLMIRGVAREQQERGRRSDRAGRASVGSVGRPAAYRREVARRFWRLVGEGWQTAAAGRECGVSVPVASRWFKDGGGMAPISLNEPSGRYLSFAEREEIAILRAQGVGVRSVARRLRRAPSTISREIRRNAATRGGRFEYRASTAQWHSERRARRPKQSKLAVNGRLRDYVQAKLSGQDDGHRPGSTVARWCGCRRVGCAGRRGLWSPEQIARRLPSEFPDDESMRISHEAIYQALYVQGRGALRRELVSCLRTGRALRKPRKRPGVRGKRQIPPEILISERPPEVDDRAVPGHWEGDLIIGARSSAVGTLVERTTRFTMLLHLPRLNDLAPAAPGEQDRGWTGHGALAVREAIAGTITTLPEQLRRSLTWDQGIEMAQHAELAIDADLEIYFCDPHSPWQRGTNENTNGLLRQYLPKNSDLSLQTADDLLDIAAALNGRPRKTLGWRTPAEALDQLLSTPPAGVARTP
jgi:IS30 family transposase